MQTLLSLCFALVGIINFLPVLGVLSATRLKAAYGIAFEGNDMAILLRHRALLFGIVGAYIFCAAFFEELRPSAFAMGFVSMIAFVVLVKLEGNYNAQIRKVMLVDIFGIVLFSIAFAIYLT